jgi:Zn-dependent protease with chaperone function
VEQAQFEALIGRMETLANANPKAYRALVLSLALLGYGYLLFVMVLLLVLLVASARAAVLQFVLLIGALLAVVLRAMWVKVSPPVGERLTPQTTPELFALLKTLRQQLHTPRLHRVLLVTDFNAAIAQVPSVGMFGWHRNYLLIGLPLMKALSVEQFRAVLAHELGHLSRGHVRAGNWIYRLRLIWLRLETIFAQRPRWGSQLIRAFYRWYIPYFNAASFPLARANEYEADATAVQLTSGRSVARALTGVSVGASYFNQRYWPAIQALAKESPEPAAAALSGFMTTGLQGVTSEEVSGWQIAALAAKTTYADTHPSLSDRLRAVGADAEFVPPSSPEESAVQLLGAERPRLEGLLDARWRTRVAESWKKAYEEAQKGRARLGELRTQATQGELQVLRALELAALEENVGAGPAAALSMRREILARVPDSAPARFALARQLLQAGDAEGITLMEGVVEQEPEAQLGGAELLRNYFYRRGDSARGQQWQERYLACSRVLVAAQRERAQFWLSDSVAPHDLATEVLARLVEQLKALPELRRAYLVRKTTKYLPDKPCYVLGFESSPRWALSNRARARAVLQSIRTSITLPGTAIIVNLEASSPRFAVKLRRIKGARVV